MKRALALLVGGVLILGSVLTAQAQAPTVSFGGQMRIYGFTFDNVTDFKDSNAGASRDSNSFYFQRFRLFTTIESADKKAKAYWALEIGDITWGAGGGASGGEWGCTGSAQVANPTVTIPPPAGSPPGTPATVANVGTPVLGGGIRTGPSGGGCLGADGVNVETKNLWLELDTASWAPGTRIRLGIQGLNFMDSAFGAVFDNDIAGIKVNWKGEMVDVEVWAGKFSEFVNANAEDTDAYAAKVGINVSKDLRLTLEGLVIDQRALAGQSLFDTFWMGATVAAKLGDVNLDGGVVYGQRAMARATSAGAGDPFQESGFGMYVVARAPVGPVNVNGLLWYTTGDSNRGPCGATAAAPGCNSNGPLTADSDMLPTPESGGGWYGATTPYIGEWINGLQAIGNPSVGQTLGNNYHGTYGFGGSVTYNLTPTTAIGGGVAYVGASDAASPKFGDSVFELDAGVMHRFNSNVTMNLLAGYLIPDKGDSAWGIAWRTVFGF